MFSKVQQKPHFHISCLQIIDKLEFVFTADAFDSFQFQNNMIVDKNVGKIFAYFLSLEINLYLILCLAVEATSLQFLEKCILIHPFQETKSQRVIYVVKRCYNLVCFVLVKIFFNHIFV